MPNDAPAKAEPASTTVFEASPASAWDRFSSASRDALVPTLTLTQETIKTLGIARADIVQAVLPANAKRLLEALLASRGFDVTRSVYVRELANGEGFLLTQ